VLTSSFFRRRFADKADLIGKGLSMATGATTLVGVLPTEFRLHFAPDANVPADVQAFIPFPYNIYNGPPTIHFIRLIARLKPGTTITEAQRDLDRVAAEIRAAYTVFNTEELQFTLSGMQADSVRDIQPALTALFAGAAFVLLICCVNVSSLLLARASDRRKEFVLRLALGASRARVLRQSLAEAGVLSLLGGLAGIAVSWAGFRGLMAIRPERFAHVSDSGLIWPVLAFASAASLATCLLFGTVPALQSHRMDHAGALRTGARGQSAGFLDRTHRRAGRALVVGEITLGFVLVTCAALTVRTLSEIERVRPGFEPRQLLTFQIAFGSTLSPGIPASTINDWETQLAALPGVAGVGATTHLPLDDFPNWYMPYRPEGITENQAATLIADYRAVTPGYLAALGVRLLEGRFFDPRDGAGAPSVVIVDELLARSTWPGESAVGKKIDALHVIDGAFVMVPSVVVGVVEHVRNHSLTKEVRPEIYVTWERSKRSPLSFVLRTRVPPLSLVPAVREMLRRRSPDVAMAKVLLMTEHVKREIAPAGFTAVLAAIFAALALLLAATGLYGVLNYQVSRRLPEMGIRMALGAAAGDVLQLVLREGLALATVGVLLGIACAQIAARSLAALLYGVSASDPLSYILALVLLPAAALLGCWRPAWRAASADPTEIIRGE
jgi:predicted permease